MLIFKPKKMKKIFTILLLAIIFLGSCKKFLAEKTYGVLSPSDYYTTSNQARAAVDGLYTGLSGYFTAELAPATSPIFDLEYLTGYTQRPRPSGGDEVQYLQLPVTNTNTTLETYWTSTYYPVENCNSVIVNLNPSTVVDTATKHKELGEAYFLRAYYYFNAVRLFGSIPLKITPTTSLNNLQLPKASVDTIYAQIVSDLTFAEKSGLPWTDVTGHVNMGAVKSLLAKVYLTMAGYPLKKGNAYYQMAYEKSLEVINSNNYSLFTNYADLRNASFNNTGEQIFMLQRSATYSPDNSILHFSLLPYPSLPISKLPDNGGAMAPDPAFYNSYSNNDARKQNQVFYYTSHTTYGSDAVITLPVPYIYKYWDDVAEQTGKNGMNVPLIRYADVLLMCAEAKATVDGGTTSDAAAISAYSKVHNRAFPTASPSTSITTDQILMERNWELAYEFQTWFDMIRTRRAFDVVNNKMVDIVGYKAPQHARAFQESDLLLPIPLTEIQKDPYLK
jgi:hypothetical protein